METKLKNKFGIMNYDSENQLTEHIWLASTEKMLHDNFKEFMLFWKKFVSKHQVKRHLIDARHFLYIIPPKQQEWIASNIVEPAVEQGLRRMAQVLPESDLFARVSVEQTMDENIEEAENLSTADFGSVEEARAWLLRRK